MSLGQGRARGRVRVHDHNQNHRKVQYSTWIWIHHQRRSPDTHAPPATCIHCVTEVELLIGGAAANTEQTYRSAGLHSDLCSTVSTLLYQHVSCVGTSVWGPRCMTTLQSDPTVASPPHLREAARILHALELLLLL